MKGTIIVKKKLTLDDLAIFRTVTWECNQKCGFCLYDKMVGGDRSDIHYEMKEHWRDKHPFELSMHENGSSDAS